SVDASSKSNGGGGGRGKTSTDTRDIKDKDRTVLCDTLNALTGQDIGDSKTWHEWWAKNEKTFTFPDPNKKDVEVDVTKLTEYKNDNYGFTIKRPDGAGWAFMGKDQWNTIQCLLKDDKNVWWCYCGWGFHNTTKS